MIKKFIFSSLVLAFLCLAGEVLQAKAYKPPVLRIAVIKNADIVTLTIKGKYKIRSVYTQEILHEGRSLKNSKVAPTISGLLVGKNPFKIFAIRIETKRDGGIFLNNRRFRGSVDIIRTEDLKLLAVNHVDVESYLYGVLYHEISPLWTMDAIKAQAIAARTFALHQKRERRKQDYDLTSDVYSQMYGGKTSEKWRTNRAVNLTRGEVLTYKGDIFPTYYHATCAGHTLDASRLWSINIEPLKGVKCDYCKKSPHYRWRRRVSFGQIEEKLNKSGHEVKGVYAIEIEGKGESGRVTNVIVKGKNKRLKIDSNKFRLVIGPNILRSAKFDLTIARDIVLFEGVGWGHGVGMCQWGSYLMSKKGYDAGEILKFYYPGAKIKVWNEVE